LGSVDVADGHRRRPAGRMRRISLVGSPGSGKTTVGRTLATYHHLRFVRLRTAAEIDAFLAALQREVAADGSAP
jgi:dephospho-CoA kinase